MWLPLSCTFAVKEAVPDCDTVPVITPPVLRVRPYVARLLLVADQLYPAPVPPEARRVWL